MICRAYTSAPPSWLGPFTMPVYRGTEKTDSKILGIYIT